MKTILTLTTAIVLVLGASQPAFAQNGRGDDGNRGRSERGDDRGRADRGGREDKGGDRQVRGRDRADRADARQERGGDDRGRRTDVRQNRGADDQKGRNDDRRGRGEQRAGRDDRPASPVVRDVSRDRNSGRDGRYDGRDGRNDDRRDRSVNRDLDRRIISTRDGGVVFLRRDRDRGLIAGCPPGLARKNNGCLPPGQARRVARDRYDYLWGRRNDGYAYRYNDGYLYRLNRQGSLLGYVPVLGGALYLGNTWPGQYSYDPVPTYYTDYYGLNDRYDYRYADGAVYGLDPRTQAISQVAALLTGQQFTVGQPMPPGYDIYNVPYGYRDQYADSADSWYRYNDGYVYQVDPTTQLVQAVIQLLT